MTFSSIPEIVDELRRGRMVVIVDDEDRENEGDLVMAASRARPEDINFMARYGRGLICLTLTRERCERLRLPLMVSGTHAKHATNFTVSIEAADGVTTGISAADRATTVQAAVAPAARAEDLVQPGHIFPLMAQPGGVLTRAGHTEAGCDLARLAGYEAAAVIVEILNEDGSKARRPELERFAAARSDAHWSLREALARISREERGVIVALRQPNEIRDVLARMRDYRLEAEGRRRTPAPAGDDLRTYGVGAQILAEVGVGRMRVLGTPKRLHGLAGFGLEVVEYVGGD